MEENQTNKKDNATTTNIEDNESSDSFCHLQANTFANLNKTVDFLGKKNLN